MFFIAQTAKNKSPKQGWRKSELERQRFCLYCDFEIKHSDPKIISTDWSFGVALGNWHHIECNNCRSLILTPRPKKEYIHKAYQSYYTHPSSGSLLLKLKRNAIDIFIRNIFDEKEVNHKCVNLIRRSIKNIIKNKIYVSRDWNYIINNTKKGKFLDVGCGSGRIVMLAQKMGWDAHGIEADQKAIADAGRRNLKITLGLADKVQDFDREFDLIYCSHVIEHLYDQRKFLEDAHRALKPGGALIITTPNSDSALRKLFGSCWRGLEAPRHIGIPSKKMLRKMLLQLNFEIEDFSDERIETFKESMDYLVRYSKDSGYAPTGPNVAAISEKINKVMCVENNDIIKFICVKK